MRQIDYLTTLASKHGSVIETNSGDKVLIITLLNLGAMLEDHGTAVFSVPSESKGLRARIAELESDLRIRNASLVAEAKVRETLESAYRGSTEAFDQMTEENNRNAAAFRKSEAARCNESANADVMGLEIVSLRAQLSHNAAAYAHLNSTFERYRSERLSK